MKKQIVYTIAFLFAISFVSAASMGVNANSQGQANLDTIARLNNGSANADIEIQMQGNIKAQMPLTKGEFTLENGQKLKVQGEKNNLKLIIGNSSVNCSENCNLTQTMVQNKVMLRATLSNGKNAEVKIMPEVASQSAISRLELNSCEESNCSIELKEVGEGNSTKLAYKVTAKKQAKFLGLFNSNVEVSTQVDAETGEIIQINKPWWVSIKAE